jgi:transcriptional regulator with XRE-family HTH domain
MAIMTGLRGIRESRGLSRPKLALHAKVSKSTIEQLEAGTIKEPSYSMTLRIAEVLQAEPAALFVPVNTDKPISLEPQETA